jgi:phospholipid/cholesterol/gamma-HCH transport system permease protein
VLVERATAKRCGLGYHFGSGEGRTRRRRPPRRAHPSYPGRVSELPATDAPSVERLPARAADGSSGVRLLGHWTLRAIGRSGPRLERELQRCTADGDLSWDLGTVESIDSAGAILVWRAWGRKLPRDLTIRPEHRSRFDRLATGPVRRPASKRDGMGALLAPLYWIGARAFDVLHHSRQLATLLGQIVLDLASVVARPSRAPWRELSATLYRAGARALGITGLVGFLVGLILAYLSAGQLRSFGAEELIVNLVGIGIFRELGPLLGCMLLAGRSGSAMTAELGAMRLTQEIDALTVLGISPSLRLVLPKVLALAVIAPLVTLWTSSMGMLGGMLVARFELGMTTREFASRLRDVLPLADVFVGTGKSIAFGVAIGLVACHYGLRVKPDTKSLGDETTASVVVGLTAVIALDAMFAVALQGVGSG